MKASEVVRDNSLSKIASDMVTKDLRTTDAAPLPGVMHPDVALESEADELYKSAEQ